jgi:hypothetical protein
MRAAPGTATRVEPELVAILRVPAARLRDVVPVPLAALDSFTEPEPSTGATIRLETGRHIVLIYGLETQQLQIHAQPADICEVVDDFLRETGLDATAIEWLRADVRCAAV